MRQIKYIVIHCTGGPQKQSVPSILNYWKSTLKWNNPGYHILIEADGTRHYLQPFEKPSNGVAGFNAGSIHISYIGGVGSDGKNTDSRTELQKASILTSIKEAMEWILKSDGPPNLMIQGHRDFPNVKKDCPCFNAKIEYAWIIS